LSDRFGTVFEAIFPAFLCFKLYQTIFVNKQGWHLLVIGSFVFLLGIGMVFPAMAESPSLKLVADSAAPQGKVFVSVDFDHDGFCDKHAVLISVTTAEKIGITGECVLSNI